LTFKTTIRNFKKKEEIINVLISARNDEDKRAIYEVISKCNDIRITCVENNETGAIIKSKRLKPDVLIMDLQPPGLDGVELAPIIRRRSPATAIIMISDRDESEYACLALQAGVSGFLHKKIDMDKLHSIVKIVNLGGYYFTSSVILRVINTISFINKFPGQLIEIQNKWKKGNNCFSLSLVERGIITKIAKGYSDKEIAKHFNYAEGTITNIINTVKRKTKLKNRMQIVIFSLFYGLISIDYPNIF
jgi:DNA-binding NarL/FixJ family response regulator